MASLGQELKRERELRSISLQEIADTTKISMKFLQALEKDQLDILPGEFFIKSIISAYAKTLGLEKDSVLNKYYETLLHQEQSQETESIKRKTFPGISKNIKKFIGSSFLLVLLILFLLFIYFVFLKKETQPPHEDINTSTLSQEMKQAKKGTVPFFIF
jgi:cytoskeletal protein RodZ